MDSTKRIARQAVLLYFLFSLPGPFALLYVPGKLFVKGDVTATAERLRSSENLLHMGIATELIGFGGFIFVGLALYRLFKPVSEGSALAMLVLALLSVPISFLCVLSEIVALDFAGGGRAAKYLSIFDPLQRDAQAYLLMDVHGWGFVIAGIFWGLWLSPFGICVIRSGFIPRILGILLLVAGSAYVANALLSWFSPSTRMRSAGSRSL